ncbi:MAG: tRNA uridine(34) 5-carboxymethylaminomethyl modification radical SAM/GNAT enzyme Elp3 [Thermoplasmata archaeon]
MSGAPDATAGPGAIHREKLARLKASGAKELLSNVDWIASLPPEERASYEGQVRRKPTRTLSGVAVVAVMTAPARCPHGRCTYCPGGVGDLSPQSYTGQEPSALRGAQFHWDARKITEHRLQALQEIGHPTSKVEVIVMGGTFPARPREYQEGVFRAIYEGLNGLPSASLTEAQARNESAEHRLVGLTVETRPDWCDQRVLPFLLDAGVTRVEIGVECLEEPVLEHVGRAHSATDVVRATRTARNSGLKVCYHMMLGLPGMTPERDLAGFERLFGDPNYRPDMLKIYPTLVLAGTALFEEHRAGRYAPYDLETTVELLTQIKSRVPPWVRIQRIQRDIPSRLIAAGVRTSNVRQLAMRRLEARGSRCACLRCREVGRRATLPQETLELHETTYAAGGGSEVFLQWTAPQSGALAGFLRLRLPASGPEIPIVRELKVLGPEVAVGDSAPHPGVFQHRGLGQSLLRRAEEISALAGHSAVRVMSAVGTRAYYRNLGYARDGPWARKSIAR